MTFASRFFLYERDGVEWIARPENAPAEAFWYAMTVQLWDAFPPELYFLIEGDVKWKVIVDLAELAHELGWSEVGFAARGPLSQLAPGRSVLDGEIARAQAIDSGELVVPIMDGRPSLFHQVAMLCPPALTALQQFAVGDTSSLIADLPDAIMACDCRIDVPSLKAVLWYETGRDLGARLVSIPVRLATGHDEDGRAFRAAATEKWSEVAPRLFEAAKSRARFRLIADDPD